MSVCSTDAQTTAMAEYVPHSLLDGIYSNRRTSTTSAAVLGYTDNIL